MTEIHDAASGTSNGAHLEIVSVADLLSRRVALHWYESVAIVAGLCSALVDDHATAIPTAGDVVLSQDGAIVIGGRSRNADPVALPRLLHKLLASNPPPMPLRLLVLNTISSDGDKSPAAFGQALAYFERPGREEMILSVRQRCLETPIPEPGSVPSEDIEELVVEATPEPPSRPTRRRGRSVAAGLLVCASIAIVLVAAGRQSGSSSDRPGALAGIVAHAKEAGRQLAHGLASALSFDANAPQEVAQTLPPAEAASPRPKSARPKKLAVGPSAPVASAASLADDVELDAHVTSISAVNEQETIAPIEVNEEAPVFYTEDTEAQLTPPRLLDPVRLPSWAQTDGNMLSRIELDINDSGIVERVRMVSPAMRLTDMMILSAAKMWIFEPATKDGRAVPYRLTLNWVSPNR